MFKIYTFIFAIALTILLLLASNLHLYEIYSLSFFSIFLLVLIEGIGKRIVIKEFMVVMATLTILVLPILFYHKFNETNHLAILWDLYMRQTVEEYYSFTLPAVIALSIGLFLKNPFLSNKAYDYDAVLRLKKFAIISSKHINFLFAIGLIGFVFFDFVPGSLKFIFYLMRFTIYVGGLFAYYSNIKYRKVYFAITFLFLFYNAISGALFGEFIYFTTLSLFVILIGNRTSFLKKLLFVVSGIYLVLLLQSIKSTYRQSYWEGKAGTSYFFELFYDKLFNLSIMEDDFSLFQVGARFNQGILVSETLEKVPSIFPYANGETIIESVRAIFLPRFLDENKRKAGGAANLERFLGIKNLSYSMNIGPIGEAYGNFGRLGGIVYMFFYGLTFNLLIYWLRKATTKNFTIILWFPFIFFYSMHVETDMLTTFNSMFKASIYLFLLIRITRLFWGLRL